MHYIWTFEEQQIAADQFQDYVKWLRFFSISAIKEPKSPLDF